MGGGEYLAQIRAHLAERGYPVHGRDYWADRGIRVTAVDGGAVAWCVRCERRPRVPGQSGSGWHVRGDEAFCDREAVAHCRDVHGV